MNRIPIPARTIPLTLAALGLISSFFSRSARADDVVILPDSRHELFETYGLYFDQQSALVYRSGGNIWGAIGGALPFLEAPSLPFQPQMFISATVNAGFSYNDNHTTLLTQTFDARTALGVDLAFTREFRATVGWMHQSGHIADNVPYPELIGPNLGNEVVFFRLIRDLGDHFRLGGTVKPIVSSDPGMKVFAADQFAEWFPGGGAASQHRFSPYLSAGLEQYGRNQIDLVYHLQIGAMIGNHCVPAGALSTNSVGAGSSPGRSPPSAATSRQ